MENDYDCSIKEKKKSKCFCCFCFFFSSFSAGIGRTGALITIDVALGLMERDLLVCTTGK